MMLIYFIIQCNSIFCFFYGFFSFWGGGGRVRKRWRNTYKISRPLENFQVKSYLESFVFLLDKLVVKYLHITFTTSYTEKCVSSSLLFLHVLIWNEQITELRFSDKNEINFLLQISVLCAIFCFIPGPN